jgi:transcriptional regulator NrdR family protein
MKKQLIKNKQTSKKFWLLVNGKQPARVSSLMLPLMKSLLAVLVMMACLMTSYGQTVTGQQQPLTPDQLRALLRQSLDREDVLVKQRDAALVHVDALEDQIKEADKTGIVDAKAIGNLLLQKIEAVKEIAELRAALDSQREATANLRTALERSEQEVVKQKEKVKTANRRTVWGVMGGIVVGALAAIAIQRH